MRNAALTHPERMQQQCRRQLAASNAKIEELQESLKLEEGYFKTAASQLRDAHAEIARLKALYEWQPIETAPKVKGKNIEIGFAGFDDTALAYYVRDDKTEICWWDANTHRAYIPTHWRYPAPPTEGEG